ncbi:hypothetical protein [Staphylococcus aureus]|nr:hypothetical protein [Staphylococcus aureus]
MKGILKENFVPSLITSLLAMSMCIYIMAVLLKVSNEKMLQ